MKGLTKVSYFQLYFHKPVPCLLREQKKYSQLSKKEFVNEQTSIYLMKVAKIFKYNKLIILSLLLGDMRFCKSNNLILIKSKLKSDVSDWNKNKTLD